MLTPLRQRSSVVAVAPRPRGGRTARTAWTRSAWRVAAARASVLSVACSALPATRADSQRPPERAVAGVAVVDSLVAAEFAKDSVGSITVGVVVGPRLAWTRSVGLADVKARR